MNKYLTSDIIKRISATLSCDDFHNFKITCQAHKMFNLYFCPECYHSGNYSGFSKKVKYTDMGINLVYNRCQKCLGHKKFFGIERTVDTIPIWQIYDILPEKRHFMCPHFTQFIPNHEISVWFPNRSKEEITLREYIIILGHLNGTDTWKY